VPFSEGGAVVNVDKMVAHAGDFGRYQYLLVLLLSVTNIVSICDCSGQLFISCSPSTGIDCLSWPTCPAKTCAGYGRPRKTSRSCSRYDTSLTTVDMADGTPD
jgi:hypothetical protein